MNKFAFEVNVWVFTCHRTDTAYEWSRPSDVPHGFNQKCLYKGDSLIAALWHMYWARWTKHNYIKLEWRTND